MHCPQSPPPTLTTCHAYPSPRSKSPPSASQFKLSRKLPILKYPFTEITNFTLAQATLELSALAPSLGGDERAVGQAREAFGDTPPRRGRGKNRRGRPRGVRGREFSVSVHRGTLLRSPIPLASSPRSLSRPSFNFRALRHKSAQSSPIRSHPCSVPDASLPRAYNDQSRSPRRRFSSVSVVVPETPRHPHKRAKRRSSISACSDPYSPPLSPSPITQRLSRTRKHSSNSPSRSPPPPLRFPSPPSGRELIPCLPHPSLTPQLSLLPAMNLGPGLAQGQARKKRTKRELAELHWQVTVHKSLAWRNSRVDMGAQESRGCGARTKTKENHALDMMDFAQGGLMIAFGRPACIADDALAGKGEKEQEKCRGVQPHWTDSLDRELVKRLWGKLLAQGCRPIPMPLGDHTTRPTPVQFPPMPRPRHAIPFPSEPPQPDSAQISGLAPAIQLPSTLCPESDPDCRPLASSIPPRRRVSALTSVFASRSHPPIPLPSVPLAPQRPRTTDSVSMPPPPPPSSLLVALADPYAPLNAPRNQSHYHAPLPLSPASAPRGTLAPAQIAAQAILRHEQARAKPIRKARPPGIGTLLRESGLRYEVALECDD